MFRFKNDSISAQSDEYIFWFQSTSKAKAENLKISKQQQITGYLTRVIWWALEKHTLLWKIPRIIFLSISKEFSLQKHFCVGSKEDIAREWNENKLDLVHNLRRNTRLSCKKFNYKWNNQWVIKSLVLLIEAEI